MKKLIPVIVILVVVIGGVVVYANKKNADKNQSSNSSSTSNMANMPDNSSSSSSSQNTQATNKVTISNFAFSPSAITVKKGTTVTWTNQDSVAHNVNETDGKDGPKSNDLNTGQSYSFTFNTAGTFNYHCSIHPDMIGKVLVTE